MAGWVLHDAMAQWNQSKFSDDYVGIWPQHIYVCHSIPSFGPLHHMAQWKPCPLVSYNIHHDSNFLIPNNYDHSYQLCLKLLDSFWIYDMISFRVFFTYNFWVAQQQVLYVFSLVYFKKTRLYTLSVQKYFRIALQLNSAGSRKHSITMSTARIFSYISQIYHAEHMLVVWCISPSSIPQSAP